MPSASWTAFNCWTATRSKCSPIRPAALGQLAIRLAPFDALVLIRERTAFPRALLAKLPNLKLISQTGKLAGHVDVAAATEHGIAIAEGVGSPVAPAELTWALIMAASRKIVPYANNLKEGLWQTASINPAAERPGPHAEGTHAGDLGLRQDRPHGGRLRQGLRHAGAGLGQRGQPGGGGGRRLSGGALARGLLRAGRRAEPAPAPERRHARHRHGGRPGAHEAATRCSSIPAAPSWWRKARWKQPCSAAGRATRRWTCSPASRCRPTRRC